MSSILQVYSVVVCIYWMDSANGTPLFQGFSVNKGFEVNLKPFEIKPLSFFKEKWSPFGRFGVRKGIVKRDLGTQVSGEGMPPTVVSPAPVFELIEEPKPEEGKEKMETSATTLRLGPDPIKPLSSNFISVPTEGLYTNIVRDILPNNNNLQNPVQPALNEIYGELPPRPVGPIPVQSAAPISAQLPMDVVPLITPPPGPPIAGVANVPFSEIPPTEGPLVRGSRLALYYGNVFLQLISQFLTNARLQFSRTPPPAIPATN